MLAPRAVSYTHLYGQIVGSIIENGRADRFIVRLCELIQRLAVDKLHIVGDLFDRGPRPDIILDRLMRHHHVCLLYTSRCV